MQGTPRTPKIPPRKSTVFLTSNKPYRIRSVTGKRWRNKNFYGDGKPVTVVRRETQEGEALLICSYKFAQRQFTFEVKDGTYTVADETASAEETEDEPDECSTPGCSNYTDPETPEDDVCLECWKKEFDEMFKIDL